MTVGNLAASEEPPFPAGCPRSGQAGRTIPHPGRVRRGAAAQETSRHGRGHWAWKDRSVSAASDTDVRDFLPRYRAYVHASYSESSSLAIIEAMAAGLPIVAGNIGPIAELCDDGVEARFWSLDDASQAAATLLELLD